MIDAAQNDFRQFVENAKAWYGRRARSNRAGFFILRITLLALAAAAPALTALDHKNSAVVVGSLVAILAGILGIGRFEQNWIRYRSTAELLRRECRRFDSCVSPYDTPDRQKLFAARTEAVLDAELNEWISLVVKDTQSTLDKPTQVEKSS